MTLWQKLIKLPIIVITQAIRYIVTFKLIHNVKRWYTLCRYQIRCGIQLSLFSSLYRDTAGHIKAHS